MERLDQINITDKKLVEDLAFLATDYAFGNGICIKSSSDPQGAIGTLPFTLIPSSFPRRLYQRVKKIQADINLLHHKISYDHEFLTSCLQSVVKSDDFICRLFDIYMKVRAEGKSQPLSLGLIRTDYLLDNLCSNEFGIKQVETNLIATSFSVMASRITDLHRYVIQNLPRELTFGEILENDEEYQNNSLSMAKGLYEAWRSYKNLRAIVVFLVEESDSNILDQRGLEYELLKSDFRIKIIYATFKDIHENSILNDKNILFYNGEEVALVYLRTGYHPNGFTCENDWAALFCIERSKAIKCPPIHYHLAGCKKIQQVLSETGILEKYIDDPKTVEQIRTTFAHIYSLEMDEEGEKAVNLAFREPHKYVLKPQREGGGNNFFDKELKEKLLELGSSPARASYILMERIFPPTVQSYLVKRGQVSGPAPIVSELGIYGYILGSSNEIIENSVVGHVLRSKIESDDEGGISAGFAFLDSPNFI